MNSAERDALLELADKIDGMRPRWPQWVQTAVTLLGMAVAAASSAAVTVWRVDRLEADRIADRAAWEERARELKAEIARGVTALRGHELGCDGLHPHRGACGGLYGGGREGAP